ncbi:MAG: cupin domain-containing protein [Phycisphaerales bacterium]|nr:MAG: cupin domain-containing protein [Phycisphaerales bacterium]
MKHRQADSPAGSISFVRDLPDTSEYVSLLAEPESRALHSGLVNLQPGEDCGWHSTENHEEMIICLQGAGELAPETGPRIPLAAGQYGYNPPHTRHCVFNTGDKTMRYIYVVAPAAP